MLPPLRSLGNAVSAAPQLSADHMAEAAAAGFRSVVNNRPDLEGGAAQPTSVELAAAAAAAGLRYVHLPVSPSLQTADEIAAFATLLDELPIPILAFCRSGARSTRLYLAATGQA